MLGNHYTVSIPESHRDQAVSQMRKVQRHFNENVTGCIKYLCTRDIADPSTFHILVVWENRELYEKNLDSAYQKTEIFDKFIEYQAAIVSAEQFTLSSFETVA